MRIVSPNWFDAPGDTVDKSNGVSAIAKNIVYIRDAVDKIVPDYTDEQKMFATACIDLFKHLDSGKLKVNMISKAVRDNQENILSVKNVSVSCDEHLSYSETFHQNCILSLQVVSFASFLNHSNPQHAIDFTIEHVKDIKDAVYAVTNRPSGSKKNTVLQIVTMYFQDDNFVELVENYQSEDFLITFQRKVRQTYLSSIPEKVVLDLDSKTSDNQIQNEQHAAPDVPAVGNVSPAPVDAPQEKSSAPVSQEDVLKDSNMPKDVEVAEPSPSQISKRSLAMRNALIITSVISCILLVYSSIITFYPHAAEKLSAVATGSETYEEKYKKLKKKYDTLMEDSDGVNSANSDLIDQIIESNDKYADNSEDYYDGDSYYDPVVYITDTGDKYHRSDCRYLNKSKIKTHLSSVEDFYDPCTVCNPPQ